MKTKQKRPQVWDSLASQGQRRRQILASKGNCERAASFCRSLMYRATSPKVKKTARADYQYFSGKCRLGKK